MSRYKRYARYKDSGVEWIGAIPEHWHIKKLKHICSESAVYGLNESAENYVEEGVRFIRTTDIDDKGNLDNNVEGVFLPEEKVRGYILKTGDLLVSRSGSLGTSLYFDEDKYGKCSYAGYLVKFRANSKNCPKFLFYFSKSNIFYIQIQLALVSSTISNFNGNKYANMMLPLPSYYEQKAISNFLDQKTAEIDTLIADKEKLIELLQEKRQAIITKAVTKGLNPNVRMKDSGIEWIGEIPEHWSAKKGRYILTIYGGYAPDSVIEIQNGIDYYKVEDLNQLGRQLFLEGAERKIDKNEHLKPVKPPVILIPKRGAAIFTNKVRISNNVCLFDSNVMGIRTRGKADVKYIAYSLLSRRLDDIADVSSIPQINNKHINSICFPFPPIEEQVNIAKYLDRKTTEIDNLIYAVREQIQIIKEYRQSLISEAVTGKIDVRDYAVNN